MQAAEKIKEMQALVRLVDEPDPGIFPDIVEKIRSHGKDIVPFLEDEWERTPNPAIQERIESLIHDINFAGILKEFDRWVKDGCRNLLQACIIISRYQYPSLEDTEVHLDMARVRKDIWLELNENLTALEQIRVFNHVFFDVHGFNGHVQQQYAPGNMFINRVLQIRKGTPLSIGLTYMLLAQSLDLPVFGIDLPGNFLLSYTRATPGGQTLETVRENILFFIDVAGGGTVYSFDEVLAFIRRTGHQPGPDFFAPADNRDIVIHMLNDLIASYELAGMPARAKDMLKLSRLSKGD